MDIENDVAAGAPKPNTTATHLVDELLAAKAETRAQKRDLVACLNQLTNAMRSARETLEDL